MMDYYVLYEYITILVIIYCLNQQRSPSQSAENDVNPKLIPRKIRSIDTAALVLSQ